VLRLNTEQQQPIHIHSAMAVQNFFDHYHYNDRYVNRETPVATLRQYTADLVDNFILTANQKEEKDLAYSAMDFTYRLHSTLRLRSKDQVARALELGIACHYLSPRVFEAWDDCLRHTAAQEKARSEMAREPVLVRPTQELYVSPRKRPEKVELGTPGDCTGPCDRGLLFPRPTDLASTINCNIIFLTVMVQAGILVHEDKEDIKAARTNTKRVLALLDRIEDHVAGGRYRTLNNLRDVFLYHLECTRNNAAVELLSQ
jgi:hypothetical protein